MQKFINIISWTLFTILIVVTTYCSTLTIISRTKHNNYVYVETVSNCPNITYQNLNILNTREELKIKIEALLKPKLFFYKEDTDSRYFGRTFIIPRIILMNKDISLEDYIFYYTHELVHLTEYTANDIYANFRAFQILYESGDSLFKQVALNNLWRDLNHYHLETYTYYYYASNYLSKGV